MAEITCAISGLPFKTNYMVGLTLQATDGYPHPIFAASKKALHRLYAAHCRGKLTKTDSYLLFLALLHSTGRVTWKHPLTISPTSIGCIQLVENNISQLVEIIEKTDAISHPSFSQPKFTVYSENSDLRNVTAYIRSCKDNITSFYNMSASERDFEALKKVENKLSYMILSGVSPEKSATMVAEWAAKAGNFPKEKAVLWKDTIRSCFSITKMFNTPLELLKEIKEHCECNIEAGSIHFHTLSQVLREGIARHVDYLGGSALALGYTILPTLTDLSEKDTPQGDVTYKKADLYVSESEAVNNKALEDIAANAPTSVPKKEDYSSNFEYLKAKTAFRVAVSLAKKAKAANALDL